MTKIEANVPDYLAKQAFAAAEREKVSVDQIVALALSAQLAAWKGSDDMASRAKRANLADFDRIMAKVMVNEKGLVQIVDISAPEGAVLGQLQLPLKEAAKETILCTPALSTRHVFLRSDSTLWRLGG